MIKNNNTLLVIGMFSLIAGILLGRYARGDHEIIDFLEGVCYGLSVTVNIVYLVKIRKQKK